ncbi:MAG: AGE family epimerase/isomerase [Anaerolineae bacterium]|nr:AGE family epimerase/isomerase [Anaerolineae bacterium]
MKIGVISPQDWGLPVAETVESLPIPGLGITGQELEQRIHACTYQWAQHHFDDAAGAFYGFYSAPEKRFEPPQTVNLIAPWQFLASYDHYGDEKLLHQAERATDWFYRHFVVTHPMSVVIGGVRESLPEGELWTKFAAEFVLLNAGLYTRTGKSQYLDRARQSAMFLIQSTRHDFAPKYDTRLSAWREMGWQSFGRVVEAFLILEAVTGESSWRELAVRWGDYGLSLLAGDGGLYLIDDDYFNTDIAADELRAFVFLHELTGQAKYLTAAERFAGWLLARQNEDGGWALTIDRDGNVVVPTVGPGDVPNIAIALLRLYDVNRHTPYMDSAMRALRYSLSIQVVPGGDQPYSDDPNVQWGFWSWMPHYDYTVSGDQATHHVRGFLFAADYLTRQHADAPA